MEKKTLHYHYNRKLFIIYDKYLIKFEFATQIYGNSEIYTEKIWKI